MANSRQRVRDSFSAKAHGYDQAALLQKHAAQRLNGYLDSWACDLPEGPVLEIGCGTGFMSEHLVRRFAGRRIVLSDVSPEMLALCRERLSSCLEEVRQAEFVILDGQAIEKLHEFSAIVCAFSLQWFDDLEESLARLLNSLVTGGKLFFSVPSSDSFPEWKAACRLAGVPFTGNWLPDAALFYAGARIYDFPCVVYEETLSAIYGSALEFFKSVKMIGAATAMHDCRLSVAQLRRLLTKWDDTFYTGVPATYHVLYGQIVSVPRFYRGMCSVPIPV